MAAATRSASGSGTAARSVAFKTPQGFSGSGLLGFLGFIGFIGFVGFIGLVGSIGFIGLRLYQYSLQAPGTNANVWNTNFKVKRLYTPDRT